MNHDRKRSPAGNISMPFSLGRAATIVVADDEWMFRACLRQLLTAPSSTIKDVYGVDVGAGFTVVGEAGSGEDTVSIVEATKPDLLILDLEMPRMLGLDVMRALQDVPWTLRTIVLAGNVGKSELFKVVQLGVRGIVLKDAATEVLFKSILAVLLGQRWLDRRLVEDLMEMVSGPAPVSNAAANRPFGLTRRELEVLALVVAGYSNKEIARACAVSEETIKHHLTHMFDKVGASNRLELAVVATKSGLVSDRGRPSVHESGAAPSSSRGREKSGHLRVKFGQRVASPPPTIDRPGGASPLRPPSMT
jgi:two-component system nitrate/nitrite response regulator NarL